MYRVYCNINIGEKTIDILPVHEIVKTHFYSHKLNFILK